ncbi:uncharacterized protein BDV17DRAFT_270869, partial [Aspergillus undulatus]|uniref:uncharacterized protein n=1 Tax=Aspergillus undulatus TaxID=1810928 RepID=UPI003CCD3549
MRYRLAWSCQCRPSNIPRPILGNTNYKTENFSACALTVSFKELSREGIGSNMICGRLVLRGILVQLVYHLLVLFRVLHRARPALQMLRPNTDRVLGRRGRSNSNQNVGMSTNYPSLQGQNTRSAELCRCQEPCSSGAGAQNGRS